MAIEQKQGSKPAPTVGTDVTVQKSRNYIKETWTELEKTTWPTTAEANRLTAVVIGVIIVLGIYMGVLDWLLSTLVNHFSLIK